MTISKDKNQATTTATEQLLASAKNGWWPYRPGRAPSLEPTVWAAIAIRDVDKKLAATTLENLLASQKSDGGWSTDPNFTASDWTTQLALIGLQSLKPLADEQSQKKIDQAYTKGLDLVMSMRTDTINDMTRILMTVFSGPDFDYPRGWPWEKGNAHWVEPTAYALLAFRLADRGAEKRYSRAMKSADEYLLSKACQPAGWNYGSPHEFSGDEAPTPYATTWALIALQTSPDNAVVQKALNYLREVSQAHISIAANALAIIALNIFGDDTAQAAKRLNAQLEAERNSDTLTITAIALSAIAMDVANQSNPLKIRTARG
jgi:hypothetical protein